MLTKRIICLFLAIALLVCLGCEKAPAATPVPEGTAAPTPIPTPVPTPTPAPIAILPEAAGFSQDAYRVFYEIYVGAYCDSNGDGIGDLKGLLSRLDHINDGDPNSAVSLGAEGIWLMPICPSPTYHKYDVTDYCEIDPQYGTLQDFDALAAACEERGIALILDLVVNHTSSDHPWFKSACKSLRTPSCGQEVCTEADLCIDHNPYIDYYNFTQEPEAGGYYVVPGAAPWHYECRFVNTMPDLNLNSEKVREEIAAIAKFWLDRGAAGFRLDAVTSYYTGNVTRSTEFMAWFMDTCKAIKEDVYVVGEAWTDGGSILRYYESGITSLFNFPFSQSDGDIIGAVRGKQGAKLAAAIESWNRELSENHPHAVDAPFLTNHDNARSAGALVGKAELMKLAAATYLLMPGTPFIYYGEEIAMQGSGRDENKRTPMVWSLSDNTGQALPPSGADDVREVKAGVAEQAADSASLLNYYIAALRLRRAHPALAKGVVTALDAGSSAVCAYASETKDVRLVVLHNYGVEEVAVPLSALNAGELSGALAAMEALPFIDGNSLILPAGATAIMR